MGEPRNSDERATCAADQCPVCHDDNSVGGWQECRDCLLDHAKTAEAENARLRAEKDSALEQAAQARAESARLAEDILALQEDRKEVRQRIEKLLGQIDELGAS